MGGFMRRVVVRGAFLALTAGRAFAAPLEAVPDEYLVEFYDADLSISAAQSAGVAPKTLANGRTINSKIKLLNRKGGVPRPSDLAVSAARAVQEGDSFCASLSKQLVRSCSPNYIVRASRTPNDVSFQSLWGLGAQSGADARPAWDLTIGSRDIVVAVLDSGVDYNHPDLVANMWRNPGEISGNGLDDDGNGYVDDVHGIDAISGSGNPQDLNGHGTHVAGTIGATGDNSIGVVGVNWETSILALRFLDAEGGGTLADAIEALNYLLDLKERGVNVRVVNASWGGGGYSEPFKRVLDQLNSHGILFVAAAGNESNDNDLRPAYPSSYEVANVLSVAALTEQQNLAGFSNYGANKVDLAAPGDDILSTVPGGYASYSGTSMATPHVAGAIALLLAQEPSLSAPQVVTRLFDTAIALPSLDGLTRTGRALNIGRLVRNETTPFEPTPIADLVCRYDVVTTRYGRDKSADQGTLVHSGDELGFVSLSLPFEFPFHKESFSTVTVSPNGVLYMGSGPGDTVFDYNPGETAPRRSIAAFHADLLAARGGGGVRVAMHQDRVTFRWVSHLYGWSEGTVGVTLTLFPDGSIRDSIEFSDLTTELVAQMGATIGLAGLVSESAFTYTTGGSSIRDGLELSFIPACDGSIKSSRVTEIRVSSSRGRGAKSVRAGESFFVDVRADRPGTTSKLGLMVNGRACSAAPRRIDLSKGTVRLRGSTLTLEGRVGVKRIGFFSSGVVGDKAVSHRPTTASARRKLRGYSASRVCREVMRSLKPVKG